MFAGGNDGGKEIKGKLQTAYTFLDSEARKKIRTIEFSMATAFKAEATAELYVDYNLQGASKIKFIGNNINNAYAYWAPPEGAGDMWDECYWATDTRIEKQVIQRVITQIPAMAGRAISLGITIDSNGYEAVDFMWVGTNIIFEEGNF